MVSYLSEIITSAVMHLYRVIVNSYKSHMRLRSALPQGIYFVDSIVYTRTSCLPCLPTFVYQASIMTPGLFACENICLKQLILVQTAQTVSKFIRSVLITQISDYCANEASFNSVHVAFFC